MAVSRAPAPPDYGSAAPAVDRATGAPPCPPVTIPFTDRALWVRVIRHARCTSSSLDPDQWFPVSVEIDKARREAAAAITVCTTCLVRAECTSALQREDDVIVWASGVIHTHGDCLVSLSRCRCREESLDLTKAENLLFPRSTLP